ncbi:MAG TPA: gas vesicle protein GvpG [Chloroflexota bacterium]|jgi:hypothetical protein|nr:gas vesicle protein GvpG [Chloroflexota bacterium]
MLLKLLGLPFSLPAAGIKFVFDQLLETAEQEMMDDTPVKEALLELQLRLEEGEISEEEFAAQEAVLFERLREVRAYREARLKEQLAAHHPQAGTRYPAEEPTGAIEYRSGSGVVEADFGEEEER